MKKIATFVSALLLVSSVAAFAAGPYYARGGYFDAGWSFDPANELVEGPAGYFSRAITSPMVAGYYEGKVALSDWSMSWPNSNMPVFITGPGDIVTWTFDTNTYSDGWSPSTNIANNDHATTGLTFEVIGSAPETGAWGSGVAANLVGDIWGIELVVATPGSYEVKFRKTGDWSINVGSDGIGTNANNYAYTTTLTNQPVLYQFNRATGRMRVVVGGVTPTQKPTWGGLKALYR
jgi:hypothetical protein